MLRRNDSTPSGSRDDDATAPPCPRPPSSRTWAAGLLLSLSLLACGVPGVAVAAGKPSIVLVMTDDQEVQLVARMPGLTRLIVRQGATFAHAYYNDPLCCPSRATILTGKYVQNTGVTANDHALFYAAGLPNATVAVWLHAAGYRTALIGKYLNLYPSPAPYSYVPPGWDYWAARIGQTEDETSRSSEEYDYDLDENGKVVHYGSAPADYATDVYAGKALDFVRKAVADGVPFFLELCVHAPHRPSTPAPRHAGLFSGLQAPRPPSFDEADVSDKPAYIRAKRRFTPGIMAAVDEEYRQRVRSLQAVDEAVGAIVDALAAGGRLDDTYLVFTSDNGWLEGQHRLQGRKGPPYEEDIRMPLYVRGPGVEPGLVVRHLVGNVDLAPTFAEWAGVAVPDGLDGRSFAALLRAGAPRPGAWRQAYPLAYTARATDVDLPSWVGVRTRRYAYVEYATGERELYDMVADPYQLQNLARSADPGLLARLSGLTATLNACKGAGCRKFEDAPLF